MTSDKGGWQINQSVNSEVSVYNLMNYVTICKYIIEPSQAEMTDYVIIAHPDR